MRGRNYRLVRRFLVPLTGLLLVLGSPATGPAQAPGLDALKQKNAALAEQTRAAVVQLYALESRLQQARGDLDRINARAAELAQRRASARRRYLAARATLGAAQRQLARQLRLLYEQDPPDAIAVVLGATSLDEAVQGLESLRRTAHATKSIVEQARSARALVRRVSKELAVQARRVDAAREQLAQTAAVLELARAERASYLGQLRREQALTASQITSLEQRAREAQQRAQQVTEQAVANAQAAPTSDAATTFTVESTSSASTSPDAATDLSEPPPPPVESVSGTPSTAPQPAPGPPRPGGTMSVYATGYCLKGTTVTGLPVGPGIVAVDPTVIPLGTRMTIPGYGEGVAADTGGGIKGARIDVWIASCAKAGAFGRTVTITFR